MAEIITSLSNGKRVYVRTRYGEPLVQQLKELGAHWDSENKAWWLGAAKRPQVEAMLAAPVPEGEPAQEDPSRVKLTGKGEYKGRTYYVGASTRDGSRVRLLTLPGGDGKYLDFWADATAVRITKTYQPREYRGRTEYTTLGSIAAFVRRQNTPGQRRVQCPECDAWHDENESCRECGGC